MKTGFYFVNVPRHALWLQVCHAESRTAQGRVVLDFITQPYAAADLAFAMNCHQEG